MNESGKSADASMLNQIERDSPELSWINGLVCILDGHFDSQDKLFRSEGYELM